MLASITPKEELAYVLPALIADAHMENGDNPTILDVETVAPNLAKELRKLGYDRLSPELLQAFTKTGDVVCLAQGDMRLFDGVVMSKYIGA